MFNDQRTALLNNLVSGAATHLALAPGIKVTALNAGNRAGLALHIAREAVQAGQLQRVLERRFEQPLVFEGSFIYLDAHDALVIWHPLPAPRNTVDETLGRMLALAGLSALNVPSGF